MAHLRKGAGGHLMKVPNGHLSRACTEVVGYWLIKRCDSDDCETAVGIPQEDIGSSDVILWNGMCWVVCDSTENAPLLVLQPEDYTVVTGCEDAACPSDPCSVPGGLMVYFFGISPCGCVDHAISNVSWRCDADLNRAYCLNAVAPSNDVTSFDERGCEGDAVDNDGSNAVFRLGNTLRGEFRSFSFLPSSDYFRGTFSFGECDMIASATNVVTSCGHQTNGDYALATGGGALIVRSDCDPDLP
jgi:hypothetical protein